MNRSIAKTRNQLQRITLKINQLKTKYTGDVYLQPNSAAENSPISNSRTHTNAVPLPQYRQKQMDYYQRPHKDVPAICGFFNKGQPTSIPKNISQSHSQNNSQSASQSSIQAYLNQQVYQKQFKIFRNEIYNYIDKCLSVNRQKQDESIDRKIKTCLEKQREREGPKWLQSNKGKNSIQERIKKIEQQTTNCLTNIQDIIVQMKKNQKYINEKVVNRQSKLRKQIKSVYACIKNICGLSNSPHSRQMQNQLELEQSFDANSLKVNTNLEELYRKLLALEKNNLQGMEQKQKYKSKLNNLYDKIQQVNIKIQNLQNRSNKKIAEASTNNEEAMKNKYNTLHESINKSNQFNLLLEKTMLSFQKKIDIIQSSNQKNRVTEHFVIDKIKQVIGADLEERISMLEESLEKNCTDLASLAESLLIIQNRAGEKTEIQNEIKSQIQSLQQKLCSLSEEGEAKEQRQRQQIKSQKQDILGQVFERITQEIPKQIERQLKKTIEQIKIQVIQKTTQCLETKRQESSISIYKSVLDEVNLLINAVEQKQLQQICQKVTGLISVVEQKQLERICESENKSIKAEQIEQMFNDLKNKICQQIEQQINHSLVLNQQELLEKIKVLNDENAHICIQKQIVEQIQTNLKNTLDKQLSQRFFNFSTTFQTQAQKITKQQNTKQVIKQHVDMEELISEVEKRYKISEICSRLQQSRKQTAKADNMMKNIKQQSEQKIQASMHAIEGKILELSDHLQESLKVFASEYINQKIQSHEITKNDTLESSEQRSQSQSQKSPKEEKDERKVLQIVEEKLNQYQNDINQTIKLLYEDIQNKVNQMINQAGIFQLRDGLETTKNQTNNLSVLIKSLILIQQTKTIQSSNHLERTVHNQLAHLKNQLIKIKSEIYAEMSTQIGKLSTVLERACQEVETKVERLDRNFSYMYQKQSTIQFDNAHFKDKLTYLLSFRNGSPMTIEHKTQIRQCETRTIESTQGNLELLGKFSTDKLHFFESV